MNYIGDWLDANISVEFDSVMTNCLISWIPPPRDWIKLNVDGSLNHDLGSISAGGVIRDDKKMWLTGFAMNKGSGSVIEAELWGILEGLNLA